MLSLPHALFRASQNTCFCGVCFFFPFFKECFQHLINMKMLSSNSEFLPGHCLLFKSCACVSSHLILMS